jgi:hypothetical protein
MLASGCGMQREVPPGDAKILSMSRPVIGAAVALAVGTLCGCAAIVGFPDRTEETPDAATGDASLATDASAEASDGGDAEVDAAPTFCQLQDGATFCDEFESASIGPSWATHDYTLNGKAVTAPDPADAANHVLELSVLADSTGTDSKEANGLYLALDTDAGTTGTVTFQVDIALQDGPSDAGQELMEIFQLYGLYVRMNVIGDTVDFADYFNDAGEHYTSTMPSPWSDGGAFHTVKVTLSPGLVPQLTAAIDGINVIAKPLNNAVFNLKGSFSWRLGSTSFPGDAGAQQVLYDNAVYFSP